MEERYYATGRRKTSVARVWITQGTGQIKVNNRAAEDIEIYFRELREDQILYVDICDEVSVERMMAATGGNRLVIVANITDPPRVN